jgi:transcriptional regulator with XRE-family HTH domain
MTQPENPSNDGCQSPAEHATSPPLTRPGLGVLVDPERMAAARKSAMLERIELASLSQTLDLRRIAAEEGLNGDLGDVDLEQIQQDMQAVRKTLADAGVTLKKPGLRIGVSRDEIAKLESGGRKRPRITTLRKLIDALNYAREARGKPPIDIEHLQVDGEVLIPEPVDSDEENPEWLPEWEQKILDKQALAAYQEAPNDIYYAEKKAEHERDLESDPQEGE